MTKSGKERSVLALEWTDIDLEARTITVSKARTIFKNQASVKSPKTKAGIRVVPIPEILYDVLHSVRKKGTSLSGHKWEAHVIERAEKCLECFHQSFKRMCWRIERIRTSEACDGY